mmetsp:Transcript_54468/g.80851  ORF Transcript_54468/g.80851 Transcript_54468/m.80851 type:complete len:848 (+) Transcript_54468:172-2715(+)
MSASDPDTIPVKYEFMNSLRRSNIGFPPKFHQLRKKLAKSFPEFAHLFENKDQILRLKYVDDEGDEVTITTNDELLAAYRLAQLSGKVLRFTVPTFDKNEATTVEAVAQKPAVKAEEPAPANVAQPADAAKAPRAVFVNKTNDSVAQRVVGALVAGIPVHFDQVCSATGATPIVGARYVLISDNLCSICEDAYNALSDADKALYTLASVAQTGKVRRVKLPRFVKQHANWMGVPVHRGVMCDVTGMKPIIGTRYNLVGADYDLCQWAYDQLSDDDKANYQAMEVDSSPHFWHRRCRRQNGNWRHGRHHGRHGHGHEHRGRGRNHCWRRRRGDDAEEDASAADQVHTGFTCDMSGMSPIVGRRWHKIGHNYDLCDAEYQKLGDEEKANYVLAPAPGAVPPFKCPRGFFGGMCPRGGFGGPGPFGPPHGPPPFGAGPPPHGPFGGPHGGPHGPFGGPNAPFRGPPPFVFGPHGPFAAAAAAATGNGNNDDDAASAKFVKDLTINDATKIAPNTSFEKAWVLRAGKTGVPEGCTLVFVGGHHLNATELRIPVQDAPVSSGKEFILRVRFTAPGSPGHYRSFWRLQTRNGRRFGPRIWADIFVTEDVNAPSGDADTSGSEPVMKFDQHVTIEPGQVIAPGQSFTKTWLVSTPTGWDAGCKLQCIDIWSTFAGLEEAVPAVPGDSQLELSITLKAPTAPGMYRSFWSLVDKEGRRFGDRLSVEFNVSASAAPSVAEAAVDDVIDECLSSIDGDDEGAHARAVEAAKKTHGEIHQEAVAQAKQNQETSDSSETKEADSEDAAAVLQQILAGINVVPSNVKAALSSALYACLSSGDFSAVIDELAKHNVHIAKK